MKKTKVLLITVVMIAVLMLAMMLTVGAETPISPEDQGAIEAGYVARVGGQYYTTLYDAVNASANEGTVYVLRDYTVTKKFNMTKNVTVRSVSDSEDERVTLTINLNHWIDTDGNSTSSVFAFDYINIDAGGHNLSYLNKETVIIGANAHVYGTGSSSYGILYADNNGAKIIVNGKVTVTGTNPAIVAKKNCYVEINDGATFNGGAFVTASDTAKVVVNGGTFNFTTGASVRGFYMSGASTTLEMNGGKIIANNASSNNVIRADGNFVVTGGEIVVNAVGNNPIRISGVAKLSGGEFKNNTAQGCFYVAEDGVLEVSGGLFRTSYAEMVRTGEQTSGKTIRVDISDGLFVIDNNRAKDAGGNMNLLKIEVGTVNISGGVFAALATYNNPIRFAGNTVATITGGTFKNETGSALIYATGSSTSVVDGITYDGAYGPFVYADSSSTMYIVDSAITGKCTCSSTMYLLGDTSYSEAQGAGVFVSQSVIDAERVATIGAPTEKEIDHPTVEGAKVKVFNHYYTSVGGAVSAMSGSNNTVILLKDFTQTTSLPKNNNVKSYTLTSRNGAVLTVGTAWLIDLGANSTVVPTIKDIEIVIPKGNGLGYFNGVSVIIDAGAYIHGQGKSASNGLITGIANANIIVKEGAVVVAENTDFPIFAVKEGSHLNIQGGTFIQTGRYSGTDEYAMFRTYNATTKLSVTGNTTMVMDIIAPNATGFMFWRNTGATMIDGENVALIARNDNYLFEQGYQDKIAGYNDSNKLYVRGAYLYTDRADGVIILRDPDAKYVDVARVSIDNDAAAVKYNYKGIAFSTRLSDVSNTRTVVIPATMNSTAVTKNVVKAYCPDVSVTCALVNPGEVIYLFADYTVTSTITVSQDVTFSSELKPDGTRYQLITKKSPAFKVTYGTLTLENIDVVCNSLLAQMYGTVVLGEGTKIDANISDRFAYVLAGGTLCIDGAIINIEYTSNNVIRCDNGTVVFNAGAMTVQNTGNDLIRVRGDFVMNGGTITNYVERNMFYLTGENDTASTMTFNGGTIISNNYNTIYADGGVATFNGGTIVQHAAAIVQIVGTASIDVRGGVFVADRDSSAAASTTLSMYLFYKNSATASASVTGGIYLLYDRDYIYLSTTSGEAQPNVAFLKNDNSFVAFGDGEYYFMGFNDQTAATPVLNGTVSLNEQTYGMVFTSTVTAETRAAIEAWAASVAGEGVDYTLRYGTLIAPVSSVLAAADFNKAAFDALGLAYLNVVASNIPAEGAFTYAAEKNGFTEAEYGVLYTAVPYVIVTVDGVDTVVYGSYQTDVSASISVLAARLLSDVTDIKTGAFIHESIAVEAAYSRFTKEQQRALKALIAHVHTNDYKGVCSACKVDSAIALEVDKTTKIYTKYENEYFYSLTLKKGVSYSFELTKAVADLVLSDAQGNACALTNGVFACTADGTYYLRATAALVGDAVLSVSHVHVRNFKGYCSVCEKDFLVAVETEAEKSTMLKMGDKYYYAVELVGGIQYQILTINGEYVVYNANGDEMSIANSTFSCEEDGTYYVVVEASVSAKGNINVKHIHACDENGDCILESCTYSKNVAFGDLYEKETVSAKEGENNYFTIELTAGNKYFLKTEGNLGVWTITAPSGETVELGTKGDFTAKEDGVYRFLLEAQVNETSTLWFEIEHECDYGYTGTCFICNAQPKDRVLTLTDGKLQRKNMKDGVIYYYSVSGMVDGATYVLTVPAKVTALLYGMQDGEFVELTAEDGKIVWSAENGTVLYLLLSAEEDIDSAELKIAHTHEIDFKGACTVSGCTENHKLYASVDSAVKVQYVSGESYYYVVEWPEAGKTYKVVLDKAEGDVVVYKPSGEIVDLAADGSFVGEKMCYYIVVTASADAQTGATFTFTVVK